MKTTHVKQAFNNAVNYYDNACHLQLQTGKHLITLLKNHCLNYDNILDVGCGTGIVTKELATAFNYTEFYAIDMADQLIKLAKEKLSHFKMHIEPADFNQLSHISILFDIIYANLSLHWSTNFSKTLMSLRDKLKVNGVLIFSIPLAGTFQEIQKYCSINSFQNFSSIKNNILDCGFNIIKAESTIITYDFDSLLKALQSIKYVGANYVAEENRDKHAFTKIRKMMQSEKIKPFKLSYHIGYFIIKI